MTPEHPEAFEYLSKTGVVDRLPTTVRLIADDEVVDVDWAHLATARAQMSAEDQDYIDLALHLGPGLI